MKTMKNLKLLMCQKALLVFLLLAPFLALGQEIKVTWDYPVKPGSEAWIQLQSNAQKVAICQIPENIIQEISTSELLIDCLNYPLFTDVFAFNNINSGFSKYLNDFNGFRELLKRSYVGVELINLYRAANPENFRTKKTIMAMGDAVVYLSELELIISYPKIIEKFSEKEKKEIVIELISKKKIKGLYPSWYKDPGMQTSYLAIYNILKSTEKIQSSEMENLKILPFIYYGLYTPDEAFIQLDKLATEFSNN